jgi:hypothetical protein
MHTIIPYTFSRHHGEMIIKYSGVYLRCVDGTASTCYLRMSRTPMGPWSRVFTVPLAWWTTSSTPTPYCLTARAHHNQSTVQKKCAYTNKNRAWCTYPMMLVENGSST